MAFGSGRIACFRTARRSMDRATSCIASRLHYLVWPSIACPLLTRATSSDDGGRALDRVRFIFIFSLLPMTRIGNDVVGSFGTKWWYMLPSHCSLGYVSIRNGPKNAVFRTPGNGNVVIKWIPDNK